MEKIDRLLKDKLESYRPDFDEAAWGAFSAKLEKAELPFYKKWFGSYSISGLVLLASGAFLFYFWPINSEIPTSSPSEDLTLVDSVFAQDTALLESATSEFTDTKGESTVLVFDSGKINNHSPVELVNTTPFPEKSPSENSKGLHIAEIPSKPKSTQISQKNSKNTLHWQDTISEREMMRYLFGTSDGVAVSTVDAHPFEEFGDSFEAEKTKHIDFNAGPLLRLMYPVDGFVTEEEGFRNPGFRVSVVWNKKFSLNMGIQTGNTKAKVNDLSEIPSNSLQQFPGLYHDFLNHFQINTYQLYFPVDLAYHLPIHNGIGFHFKAGVVPHYLRKQDFYYNSPLSSSTFGYWAHHTEPKSWQISYLQTGLGVNYQLSRRFSAYLDGEYWHSVRPIGGEQNSYRRMGLSVGLNFHLLPE